MRTKADNIRANQTFLFEEKIHESAKADMSLFECVDVEIAAKITHLNGKTNSKVITKEEKSTYKAKYCSTARTTVRMWWVCKFVCHFMDDLINSPEKELVPCVQQAY